MIELILNNFLVVKGFLPRRIFDECIGDLTFKNPEFFKTLRATHRVPHNIDANIKAYATSSNSIILPRGYKEQLTKKLDESNIKYTITDKRIDSRIKDLVYSNTNLWDHQKKTSINAIRLEQATIVTPAGGGKTEIGTELISETNQKTIIIVPTLSLVKQWINRIKDRLNYDAGIIQGSNIKVRDITVASSMTLYRNKKLDIYKHFGMVLLDEAHHAPANSFRKTIQKFHAKYRFGLTADIKRSDNLDKYLLAVCGRKIEYVDNQDLYDQGILIKPTIVPISTQLTVPDSILNKWHKLSEAIVTNDDRNKLIASIIEKELNDGNNLLVLSDRKAHLTNIRNCIKDSNKKKTKIITADLSMDKRQLRIDNFKKGKLRCILSTQLADEGLDLPNLNVVILTYPTKSRTKIIQRVGRVQRIFPGKSTAKVYDLVDTKVVTLMNQFSNRKRIYNVKYFKIAPMITNLN